MLTKRVATVTNAAYQASARCSARMMSTEGGDSPQDREQIVRGAMKDFLKKVESSHGSSIWAKLKNDVSGADKKRSPKPSDDKPEESSGADGAPRAQNQGPRPTYQGQRTGYQGQRTGHQGQRPFQGQRPQGQHQGSRPAYQQSQAGQQQGQAGQSQGQYPPRRDFTPRPGGAGRPPFAPRGPFIPGPPGSPFNRNTQLPPGTAADGLNRRFAKKFVSSKPRSTMSAAMRAMMEDNANFAKVVAAGKHHVDTTGMDPLDELMAVAFYESYKTKSSEFMAFVPGTRTVRIPKARSLEQMLAASTPCINAPRDSAGYALALHSWPALDRNYYYNPEEKSAFVNEIAALQNQFLAECDSEDYDDIDEALDPTFRKGLPYWEEQMAEELLNSAAPTVESYEEGDTDWDIEAVEDEDML